MSAGQVTAIITTAAAAIIVIVVSRELQGSCVDGLSQRNLQSFNQSLSGKYVSWTYKW